MEVNIKTLNIKGNKAVTFNSTKIIQTFERCFTGCKLRVWKLNFTSKSFCSQVTLEN